MLTFTMWPQAVDQTEIICEWHFHPDEIKRPDFNPQDAVEFWDITNKQDWELSDMAQHGISSKGYQPARIPTAKNYCWRWTGSCWNG